MKKKNNNSNTMLEKFVKPTIFEKEENFVDMLIRDGKTIKEDVLHTLEANVGNELTAGEIAKLIDITDDEYWDYTAKSKVGMAIKMLIDDGKTIEKFKPCIYVENFKPSNQCCGTIDEMIKLTESQLRVEIERLKNRLDMFSTIKLRKEEMKNDLKENSYTIREFAKKYNINYWTFKANVHNIFTTLSQDCITYLMQ